VSILLGKGDRTFAPASSYQVGAGPVALVVADFNGDGRADLATANRYGNSISILQGAGDGTFASFTEVTAGQEPSSMVAEISTAMASWIWRSHRAAAWASCLAPGMANSNRSSPTWLELWLEPRPPR